mgnify:CR=1 FL=1
MCTCGISRRNLQERLNSMRSPVYRHLRGCPLAVWSCACRGAYPSVCVCGQAHGSRSCGGVRDFHFGIFSPRCVWFTEWPHWCVGHQRCCRSSHFVWRAQWAGNQEATPVRAQARCPQRWWSIACRTYNAHHRTHWYAASRCGVVVARPRVWFDEWSRVFQTPWRGLHWTHTTKLPTCSRPSVMIV